MKIYLKPTYFLDSDHPDVIHFAQKTCQGLSDPIQKAVALYLAVRDGWPYDPYHIDMKKEAMKASSVLKQKSAYCITKAVLLSALARVVQIPARLGFADVRNHLSTERFKKMMKTDVYVYHGYSEFYLNHKWVKATPAFNKSLCEKFGVHPLEFNGLEDSIFHEFDTQGNKHMEYIKDRGVYDDVPFEDIKEALMSHYPEMFEWLTRGGCGDFFKEAHR